MAAALGIGQLASIGEFLARKKAIAETYTRELGEVPGIVSQLAPSRNVDCSLWLSTILCEDDSRPLLRHLAADGIQTRPLWRPLTRLPYLRSCHVIEEEVARSLAEKCLSLPCSVGLKDAEQASVIEKIRSYFHGTSR